MKTIHIRSKISTFTFLFTLLFITGFTSQSLRAEGNTITGHVFYNSSIPAGMPGTSVSLVSGGISIANTTTDNNGRFMFYTVPDGTYSVLVSTTLPWGGVNSTDCYLMLLHAIEDTPLSGLKLIASDVNVSAYTNSLDALVASRRFTGLINSFPSGDFYFQPSVVTVSGGVTQVVNINGIAYGDVNASYQFNMPGKTEASIGQAPGQVVRMNPLQEVILPVIIQESQPVNAISLNLGYSPDQLEILSVNNETGGGNFLAHVSEGQIRIAWYDLKPFMPSFTEPSFTIRAKAKAGVPNAQTIGLTLAAGSEISGIKGQRTGNTTVILPEIKLEQSNSNFQASLKISPNPVCNDCRINYFSLSSQPGSIKVKNLLGAVMLEENFDLENGNNSKMISIEDLPKGVYILEIWSDSKKLESKKIIKS